MVYCERCDTVLEDPFPPTEAKAGSIDVSVASCTYCDPPPAEEPAGAPSDG